MIEKNCKRIRLIYGIILSVLLIVTGILLITSCVSIYRLGNRPFTVKHISDAFGKIKLIIFITLGAIAGGILLNLILPSKKNGSHHDSNKKMTASRLWKKLDMTSCGYDTAAKLAKEKNFRMILRAVYAFICVTIYIPTAVYALNFDNYSLEKYNASVVAVCIWLIPCTLIAIGLGIIMLYIEEKSLDREIALLKSEIASGAKKDTEKKSSESKLIPRLILGARIAVLALAVFFIIEGITNGGASDVLIKAINICTECIGLG